MNFIDPFTIVNTLGIAVGALGALVLIVGAVLSLFVDSDHPALRPPTVTELTFRPATESAAADEIVLVAA